MGLAATGMRLVMVTVGSAEQAAAMARSLVGEYLAACVNVVGPIRSIYRWRGRVEDGQEYLLLIKTRAATYQALETRVRTLHKYQVPEVVAFKAERGLGAYLDWVAQSTKTAKPRGAARRRKAHDRQQ